ncbi:MAG: hypothetical protein ACM3S1_11210 [Hyphomicrobiales bacterium]
MRKIAVALGLFVLGAVMVTWSLVRGGEAEAATGPCGTTHDAVSAEEQQLVGLLEAWRAQHVPGSQQLEYSGALNAAAAWYAQHQVEAGPFGGHQDQYGRIWVDRAIDCGYSSTYALVSGEGVYVYASSGNPNIGPNEAMQGLDYPGSGINMPAGSPSLPSKCVGVGVYRAGGATAWVVIIAQYPVNSPCPASTAAPPTPPTNTVTSTATSTPTSTRTSTTTTTATATSTPTETATVTPTSTVTETPSQGTFRRYLPGLACDSCLAVVPTLTPTPTATATPAPTQTSTPTPTPTHTATPTPTATSTPLPDNCNAVPGWVVCLVSGNPMDPGFAVTVEATQDAGSPAVEVRITQPGDTDACGITEKTYAGGTLAFDYYDDFPLCGPLGLGSYHIEVRVNGDTITTATYTLVAG